jgi:DNA polymerase
LPARLNTLADALELANRKDAAGERLMQQMARPRRPRKGEDPATIYWFDDPERLQRLGRYCCQDVEVEREVYETLPPLSAAEQRLWQLTCTINDRGFRIDRDFIAPAQRIARAAASEIDAELAEITGGAVTGVNQVARILQWVRANG